MVRTINLNTEIPGNRELTIKLPDDVPTGPADLVLIVSSVPAGKALTLGDLARSEFFGMWRDRVDIQDSSDFARQLRDQAWRRSA